MALEDDNADTSFFTDGRGYLCRANDTGGILRDFNTPLLYPAN